MIGHELDSSSQFDVDVIYERTHFYRQVLIRRRHLGRTVLRLPSLQLPTRPLLRRLRLLRVRQQTRQTMDKRHLTILSL